MARSARLWVGAAITASGLLAYFLNLDYLQLLNNGRLAGEKVGMFFSLQLLVVAVSATLTWRALRELDRPSGPVPVGLGVLGVAGSALVGLVALNLAYLAYEPNLSIGNYLRSVVRLELPVLVVAAAVALVAARVLGRDPAERRCLRWWSLASALAFGSAGSLAVILSLPPFQRIVAVLGVPHGYRVYWLASAVVAFALCALVARTALRSMSSDSAVPAVATATALTALFGVSSAVRPLALSRVSVANQPLHTVRFAITWLIVALLYAALATAAGARLERRRAVANTPV